MQSKNGVMSRRGRQKRIKDDRFDCTDNFALAFSFLETEKSLVPGDFLAAFSSDFANAPRRNLTLD